MGRRGPDLAVCAGVFIGCSGIVGIAKTAVPEVDPGNLVPRIAGPAGSPEYSLGNRGTHDFAAVVRHIGATAAVPMPGVTCTVGARERIGPASPVDAQHRRLIGRGK